MKRGGRWICSRCLRAAPSARVLRRWAGSTPCFALQAQPDSSALSRLRLPTQLSPASDSSGPETQQRASNPGRGPGHYHPEDNIEDPFGHTLEDGFNEDTLGTAFEDGFNEDGFIEYLFGFNFEDFENAPQPAAAFRCGDSAASSAAAPDTSAPAPRTSRPPAAGSQGNEGDDFENAPQPAAASRCGDAAASSAAAPDTSAPAPRTSRPPAAGSQGNEGFPQQERFPDASAPQLELAGFTLGEGHRIAHHRGLFWCWRCGAFGATLPRNLRLACRGQPARAGAGYLRRLRRGLPPLPQRDWPLAEDEAPPAGLL